MTMTISEALKDAEWLIKSAYEMGAHELGYDPMAVIRSRLEVTDEKVERACDAYDSFVDPEFFALPDAMKAALVAALGDEHET